MKIYADENIERSIIEGLRRRKIEIESLREKGKPVVYIKLKKLTPQKSRIRHITIELAKAG